MATRRTDPYGRSNFTVTIGGTNVDGVAEVSGLGMEVGESEYRSGSAKSPTTRKVPGLVKLTSVTLKRGVTSDLTLFNWINSVRNGNLDFRLVVITLLDETMNPVMKWTLQNALPIRWLGPTLCAESGERAWESIEFTYDGLSME